MTEANKIENAAESSEAKIDELKTDEERLAYIEKFYRDNYDLPLPDMSLSLTEGGLGEAILDLLVKHKMLPEGKTLKSFVLPVDFSKGSLPLVLWLQDEETQLELPLPDVPQKKYLN